MRRFLFTLTFAMALYAQGLSVNGNWAGTLHAGAASLRCNVHLDGSGGTWESVDQAATLPVKSVAVSGRAVHVHVGIAKFEGTLTDAGDAIEGTFEQGPAKLPLTLKRVTGNFAKAARPQEPVRPFPYLEEEITVRTAGGLELAGTWTKPKSGGPFPAALLISGSGAQDRDESLMGHRPFLVLSDSLTRLGLAVLRLDDRGTGKSGGVFAETSYADKVSDVEAAVRYLKSREDVDGSRVGLIGHSEGGTIGPMAAGRSPGVAFVVMMAGMGIPGPELLKQQGIDVTRAAGGSEAQIARQVEIQGKLFAIYREPITPEEKRERVRTLLGPAAGGQIAMMESLTFRDLLALDPGPILRKLTCPVLALNGSLDTQVSAKQNLPAIAAALAESSSKDWQVVQLPGLNHLFQTAKTGGVGEYNSIEETIAPLALRAVNAWLSGRFLTQR